MAWAFVDAAGDPLKITDAVACVPDAGDFGPEQATTAHVQCCGEEGERKQQCDKQANARGGTQATERRNAGEPECLQRQDNGEVRRNNRRQSGPPGAVQSMMTVDGGGQLLAVAADKQQCVVGSGTKHEDAGDARSGAIRGKPAGGLRNAAGNQRGSPVSQCRDGKRHKPEDGGAVGDDQQHRHHQGGHPEQGEIGAIECGCSISGETSRTGDVRVDTGDRGVINRGA